MVILSFHKRSMLRKILERFELNKEKHMNVPLDSHFEISSILCPSSVEEKDYMSRVSYVNSVDVCDGVY